MLLGLVRPTSGRATLLGEAVGRAAVLRRVGFVPEKFQLPSFLTAAEFLEVHGRLAGVRQPDLARRVDAGLEQVGLATRRADRVGGFSKGMQQRLVLAQALLHEPELVVLDEPTSALDPVGRREVRDLIRAAHGRGATVLLNSHLLSEVEAVCDHVAILRAGKLIKQGAIRSLAANGLSVEVRLAGFGDALEAALREQVTEFAVRPGQADEPTVLTFRVPDESALPAVAAAIVGHGAALFAMVPHGESLEDLFMRLMEGT